MATPTTDGADEGHLDLVPMIDCIMLLLLFFMMTTKFSAEEKSIASLLPTNQGPGPVMKQIDPPRTITVSIYPAGLTRGYQPSDYARQLAGMHLPGQVVGDAYLRIGNREPFLISGKTLTHRDSDHPQAMTKLMDRIHGYIADELVKYEKPGEPRNQQPDIIISCFSGLSWKFALITYDGIRAYEGQAGAVGLENKTGQVDKSGQLVYSGNPEQLSAARAVTFAPPRIRDYTANELGDELYEIVHHH